MSENNPQVPWTDEQWASVNKAIQDEAQRARVAAGFLPLYGPLAASADFVRREDIAYLDRPERAQPPKELAISDKQTMQLATLEVKVRARGAQLADPEMRSVLALFRRAANVLARLEDVVVFRGLLGAPPRPPENTSLPPEIWEIRSEEGMKGLWPHPFPPAPSDPDPPPIQIASGGQALVEGVSRAIGRLESNGQFGPFAVVLSQSLFQTAQTPDQGSLVSPQDRIIPFLGGGPLLRSSTLPDANGVVSSGVVVALGGAPVELVVATDILLSFLQVTEQSDFLFRVFEKMRLQIKEPNAIMKLFVAPASTPAGSRNRSGRLPRRQRSAPDA
jgi:uncharacterized linocin/CFP29 family protein